MISDQVYEYLGKEKTGGPENSFSHGEAHVLQHILKSVVVKCLFSWYYHGSSFFATLVLTLDVYDSQINSRTIDLYLGGKIPKFNFRVDN